MIPWAFSSHLCEILDDSHNLSCVLESNHLFGRRECVWMTVVKSAWATFSHSTSYPASVHQGWPKISYRMAHSDALAPRASLHVGDLVDNGLSPNPGTISRDALLDMSGGSLKQFLTYASGEDTSYVRQVHRLWRTLLITFRSPSVINGHMTAVCNTISVFLQSASSSPVLSVQTFAMSAETWMAAFDALLDTFDSGKSKPLRQVLNTLIKILGQHGDRTRARFLQEGVLSRMASIILLGKPVSHFKASMVIFDAVIRSGIPASRILLAIGRCYGLNHDQWDHRLGRQGMDVSDFREAMNNTAADESVCHFGFSIILAIADSNVQASAGTFFTRIMAMLTEYGVSFGVLWVDLVVVTLHRYPHAIEAFKNYLLPPILKMYPNHYYLLLHRMTSKNTESSMLQNALTIAKLGCDAGLLSGEGTSHPTKQNGQAVSVRASKN